MIQSNYQTQLIPLHDHSWLLKQRVAGYVTALCLKTASEMVAQENISLLDIEAECKKIIKSHECSATFKGYNGFPGAICLSVNKEIVHGIPNDYIIKDGDIVKVDVGVTYCGAIGDAAVTVIKGKAQKSIHQELVDSCKKSLELAIGSVAVGKQIGCVGETIFRHCRDTRFKLITAYGGHGIDENCLHAPPFVDNKSKSDLGVRIQPGMTFTIEPMFVIGDTKTTTASNGWTISAKDMAAHFEHTLFVHEDHVEIITGLDKV
jgi:methionyl aminopeptidase